MRLLDLFCGGGGASEGYRIAGFTEIVGVDIRPQPHYPFDFIQADATEPSLDLDLGAFDLVHASPPCQRYTRARNLTRAQGSRVSSVDLVAPTRRLLREGARAWVIENVEGSPLLDPIRLCGSSFGLKVRRHRLFESSFCLVAPECDHKSQGRPVGVYHRLADDIPHGGRTARTLEEGQSAMGIDWLPWDSLKEAVPPAYTEFIGRAFLAHSRGTAS